MKETLNTIYNELKQAHTNNDTRASLHSFRSDKRYALTMENRGLTTAMSIVNTHIKKGE